MPRACQNAVSQPSPPVIGLTNQQNLDGGLPVVAGFIFRSGGNDWDAGIDAGGNYNPPFNTLGGTWGTQTAFSNPTSGSNVNFILTFTVGVGYTWVLDNLSPPVTPPTPNPATVSFVRDNGLQGISDVRATDYHNAIMIVTRSKATPTEALIDTLQFTFLDNSGLTPCGSLAGLVTAGNSVSLGREWIISDSDLSQTSWQLTGRIRVTNAATGNDAQVAIYTVPLVNKVFTTCNGCAACPAV